MCTSLLVAGGFVNEGVNSCVGKGIQQDLRLLCDPLLRRAQDTRLMSANPNR
jgi:hypothetical protein